MSVNKTNSRIRSLSPVLIDKIAAGEVIEGPSSVIKELIENSLDARASSIRIETQAAGLEHITVEDNGEGIHPEDLAASITRHATSKIASLEDLESLLSLGFRGEALAAIASVSHLQIKSRCPDQKSGQQILCQGGKVLHNKAVNHTQGTTIRVSNLFYSTPARRNYLKSARTENTKNHKQIIQLALARSQSAFAYFREGKEFASYRLAQSLYERIDQIYGKQLSSHLLEAGGEYMDVKFFAYISSPEYYRANREGQFSFINNRPVETRHLSFLVRKAYEELLGPGMHPYFFLFFEISPERLDANVHPQKKEIRLLDQSLLHGLVFNAVRTALRPRTPLRLEQLSHRKETDSQSPKTMFHQPQDMLFQKELQVSPGYILNFGARQTQSQTSSQSSQALQEKRSALPDADTRSKIESLPATPGQDPPGELQPAFSLARHFGTILGTYVLAEDNNSLYIIDQHTAHERVNYELTLSRLETLQNQRQGLLEPILVDCLSDELDNILAHKEKLCENGFVIEAAGPRAYLVREVPPYLDPGTEIDVLVHLIHRVLEGEHGIHLYKDYAAMRACKASIKKNDHISSALLGEILKALPKCKEPGRCPHGRPTLMRISRQELDRMFQR